MSKVFFDGSRLFRSNRIYINFHAVEKNVLLCDCIEKVIFTPGAFHRVSSVLNENVYLSIFLRVLVKADSCEVRFWNKVTEDIFNVFPQFFFNLCLGV